MGIVGVGDGVLLPLDVHAVFFGLQVARFIFSRVLHIELDKISS